MKMRICLLSIKRPVLRCIPASGIGSTHWAAFYCITMMQRASLRIFIPYTVWTRALPVLWSLSTAMRRSFCARHFTATPLIGNTLPSATVSLPRCRAPSPFPWHTPAHLLFARKSVLTVCLPTQIMKSFPIPLPQSGAAASETGRTHQIRVHMGTIGCPLTGDFLYGTENQSLIRRPALHSSKLSFLHPLSKKQLHLYRSLPKDMEALLDNVVKSRSIRI